MEHVCQITIDVMSSARAPAGCAELSCDGIGRLELPARSQQGLFKSGTLPVTFTVSLVAATSALAGQLKVTATRRLVTTAGSQAESNTGPLPRPDRDPARDSYVGRVGMMSAGIKVADQLLHPANANGLP